MEQMRDSIGTLKCVLFFRIIAAIVCDRLVATPMEYILFCKHTTERLQHPGYTLDVNCKHIVVLNPNICFFWEQQQTNHDTTTSCSQNVLSRSEIALMYFDVVALPPLGYVLQQHHC